MAMSFDDMEDFFLAGITDDMYMELTKEDTRAILDEILMAALPSFEFPKQADLLDVDQYSREFFCDLTTEEMMIIRQYMIAEWIGYQLATIDNIRQKYSGSDFKFTSQAAHIKQLIALKEEYEKRGFHLQRLYSRRETDDDGYIKSTFSHIMEVN
jgi:hypothetical protein